MFAKKDDGIAVCLADFNGLKKGAEIPPVNEMYAVAQEWADKNGWADLPEWYGQPTPKTIEQVGAERLAAYANQLTGSDRHFAEAARLEAVGDAEGAEAARTAGLARYEEIRAEHPWPDPITN